MYVLPGTTDLSLPGPAKYNKARRAEGARRRGDLSVALSVAASSGSRRRGNDGGGRRPEVNFISRHGGLWEPTEGAGG